MGRWPLSLAQARADPGDPSLATGGQYGGTTGCNKQSAVLHKCRRFVLVMGDSFPPSSQNGNHGDPGRATGGQIEPPAARWGYGRLVPTYQSGAIPA